MRPAVPLMEWMSWVATCTERRTRAHQKRPLAGQSYRERGQVGGRCLQIGRLDAAWLHSSRLCRRRRRLRLLLREPQRCRRLGAVGFDLRPQDLALLHRCLNKLRHECVVLEPAPRGHCLAEWAHWGHREGPENALAAESVRASERHRVCEGLQADHAAQLAQEIVEATERVEVCGSRADRHSSAT